MPGPRARWHTVLQMMFRDRDYRALFIELFLFGFAMGAVVPFLALWVVRVLHGSTSQAAFVFVPQGLVGIISGVFAGALSDRMGRRKELLLAGLSITSVCWFGLAFVRNYDAALLITGIGGLGGGGLLFAMLGDTIYHKQQAGAQFGGSVGLITTLERAGFSLGFLAGPVLGGLVVSFGGYSNVFRVAGIILAIAAFVGGFSLRDLGARTRAGSPRAQRLRSRELALVGLLALVGICLTAGDTGRSMFLPLYLTKTLHLPVVDVSWAFSATVLGEMIFMPMAGMMADRWGAIRVLIGGGIGQAIFFFVLSLSTRYWEILILQLLYAFVVSTTTGVAIVFSQQILSARRMGLATTTYQQMRGLAPLTNTAIALLAVSVFPRIFQSLAGLALLGVALILIIQAVKRPLAAFEEVAGR